MIPAVLVMHDYNGSHDQSAVSIYKLLRMMEYIWYLFTMVPGVTMTSQSVSSPSPQYLQVMIKHDYNGSHDQSEDRLYKLVRRLEYIW